MNLQFIDIPTIVGLSGMSLLLSASVLRLLLFFNVTQKSAIFIALIVFALSCISISGYSINFYLRGLFNDLSISSLVLLSYYFITSGNTLHAGTAPADKSQTRPVFYLTALTGLFFYPAVLGLGAIDPYSWGFINKAYDHYSALIFIGCLAGLMFFSFIKQYDLLLLCLVLSTLAYQSGILESLNLWDYLLDPLIFIYAFITVIFSINKKINPF